MSAWPKKVNWLGWTVGIVLTLVVLAVLFAVIKSASGSISGGYGKQISDAGNE